MTDATQAMHPPTAQPFATWNPTRGIWETTQLDLFGLSAPFSAIWPTCGWMQDGSAYRLPLSALLTNASASSPSPGALFRTPLATDSSRGGETLDQVRARRGTIALSHQIIDFALHGPAGSSNRRAGSETLWSLIDGLFSDGDATPTPSLVGNTSPGDPRQRQPSPDDADGPRPAPAFVEWLMGLPTGWVTDSGGLTQNQQITALGNGLLPLQAVSALSLLAA
ncbi:hypothetical protein [Propionicicella superfundia]|uniref:hypothetical protein n=1 Tax=Propionicicella superfundia TaxID=348582 RepID=UPI001FE1FB6E|nr:hypothetical protein [Propionicicella superfundia]